MGAFVHPCQTIRKKLPSDSASVCGVFADSVIASRELLVDLPWKWTLIYADEEAGDDPDMCGSTWALRRELEKGDGSKFAPYVRLLLQQDVGIPNAWSGEGLDLLNKVVGPNLVPRDNTRHLEWWESSCHGDPVEDPFGANAALIQVARAVVVHEYGPGGQVHQSRTIMAPYYDLYNHRNGRWHNTLVVAELFQKFQVYARTDIAAGEQIYNSYSNQWAVSEVFRDYGFVEQAPRTWHFDVPEVEDGVSGLYPMKFMVDDDKLLTWIEPAPQPPGPARAFLLSELERLDVVRRWADENREAVGRVPENEASKVWAYHSALSDALRAAEQGLPGRSDEL